MKLFLFLLSFLLTDARLYFRKAGRVQVNWKDISAGQRASTIASNSFTNDVWIITKTPFPSGGYKLAHLNQNIW